MASNLGTAIIDFGTAGQEASVAVTGESTVSATSKAEAWLMGSDTTSDHTAADHEYARLFIALTCGTPTAGVGFTIYARSIHQLRGTFTVRWVWAD